MISYTLIVVTVLLLAGSQVLQKKAAEGLGRHARGLDRLQELFGSLFFWLAVLMLMLALASWLLALGVTPVSKAYPALSLSFALTAVLSQAMLNERVGALHWLGILLIICGAGLLLSSP